MYNYCKNILGMTVKDTSPTKPAVVSSLKATKVKANSMKLTWKKAKNANNYYVYQYVNKKWSKINETSETSYTVIDLKPATTYKYKIVSVNSTAISSAKSDAKTVTAYTKTATPTLTSVTRKSSKSAVLTFNQDKYAKNYVVYVSTKGKKYTKVATFKNSKSGKTTYTLKTGLKAGKVNYVKIKAFTTINNKDVYSDFSEVVNLEL